MLPKSDEGLAKIGKGCGGQNVSKKAKTEGRITFVDTRWRMSNEVCPEGD